MYWRILPVRELSLRRWDDEWVASDAISGDTHLLSFAAGVIIEQLRAGPSTVMALARATQSNEASAQECLDALTAMHIVEPCPN